MDFAISKEVVDAARSFFFGTPLVALPKYDDWFTFSIGYNAKFASHGCKDWLLLGSIKSVIL